MHYQYPSIRIFKYLTLDIQNNQYGIRTFNYLRGNGYKHRVNFQTRAIKEKI
jgi:hypothetical protein